MTPSSLTVHHWGSWPQQHHPGYGMMVGLSYSHYDTRAVSSSPMVPSTMVPHYVAPPVYDIPPLKSPHYSAHHQYSYPPYEPPALTTAHPPRVNGGPLQERPSPNLQMAPTRPPPQEHRQESPSSRRGSLPPLTVPHPMHTKDIIYNKPIKTEGVDFSTPVDVMMKALQKTNAKDAVAIAVASPGSDGSSAKGEPTPPPHDGSNGSARTGTAKAKRFHCPFDGCNKSFTQSTHLETHKRAHTGEKPYLCSWPGCERRFSQPGNLKTHYRLHTGERPFRCESCDSSFAQRGNLRAHMSTHSNVKPFLCKLEDCTKSFTTRGNLKNHQNKYHKETISQLIDWIVSVEDINSLSEEDRELLWYFTNIYKNSNKGIKGRGRGRRVSKVRMGKGKMASAVEMHKSNALGSPLTRLGFT